MTWNGAKWAFAPLSCFVKVFYHSNRQRNKTVKEDRKPEEPNRHGSQNEALNQYLTALIHDAAAVASAKNFSSTVSMISIN